MLLTVPDGMRHIVCSARRPIPHEASEESEALFDSVIG
jgi:hypothetical protein